MMCVPVAAQEAPERALLSSLKVADRNGEGARKPAAMTIEVEGKIVKEGCPEHPDAKTAPWSTRP
jgi:hypothetical protein